MVRRRKALGRKLRRDMAQNAMQFLAMIALCFLGTWVFAGLDANWRMEERTIEEWLTEGRLSDFWVTQSVISRQDVYRVRELEGVEQVQQRITLEADCLELPGEVTAAIQAFDGLPKMNVPKVREGEPIREGDLRGCWIEEQFAQAQGLSVGDRLRISVGGEERDVWIRGTVLSPEYLITSNDVGPDPGQYGFLIMNAKAFPGIPMNQMLIAAAEGTDLTGMEQRLAETLPQAVIQSQNTHGATAQSRNYVRLFRNMSYLFPVLAYFVAAMVVMTTISRLLDTQRIQMGTLKALGYENRQIRNHYLAYAFWPSLLGSAAGLMAAQVTLPQVLWPLVAVNVRVPEVRMAPISPISWGMAGAEILLAVGLCVRHERTLARECAADLLRPRPPRAGTRILLERVRPVWSRLSFNGKMIIRNIVRNKGRTMMSMLGMLFCNMLIICSFGLQESIPYFVREYYEGTVGYELRVNLDAGMAGRLESYQARIQAEQVEGLMEKSVRLRTPETTRTVGLTVLPESTTLLRLGEEHTVLPLPENGMAVTPKLAEKLKVQAGDTVELWLTGETEPIRIRVAAIAQSNIGQSAFMSRKAWERLRKGEFRPTALMLRGVTPRGRQQLEDMEEMKKILDPALQQQDTLKVMDSAAAAFSILSAVALGLAFVICYNMGLLNFTERTREYATLKVLGYHQKEIRRLMLRENSLVALVGVGIGIPPGILLVQVILKMCEFDSMIFQAHITWPTVALSSAATFAFTWLIQCFLTRKVRSIDMVEALKSVE